MRYVSIAAGRSVVDQGQYGGSFYVCDSGEFKVIMKAPGSDKPQVLKTLQQAGAHTRPLFGSM
jgi:CRP-like cAMP-binding protein